MGNANSSEVTRRTLLQSLAGIAASCGVVATTEAIEAAPKPLLLVLRVPRHLSRKKLELIRAEWDKIQRGARDMPPVVILDKGLSLEAVLDPRE